MFKNLQELVQEIESGKDTQKIVEERLSYLESDEYQKKLYRGDNSSTCEFIQGFIRSDTVIGISNILGETRYWMDEKEIFSYIIDNLIRKNLSVIKQNNGIPIKPLIREVRNYFQLGQPKSDSLEIYNEMKKEGLSRKSFRENFGERYNKHYLKKKDENEKQQILYNDLVETFPGEIPIPISAIKGLNIGECTEMALLSQNILAFLGYNVFIIQGNVINSNGEQEGHNFNAMEKNGKYVIFDSAIQAFGLAPQIEIPEDLLTFDSMIVKNTGPYGQVEYFSKRNKQKYSNPEDKMRILSERGEKFMEKSMVELKEIMLSKQLVKEGDDR